ncbi:signal peptidase I, partial [Candidatus Woesearchaeota archaeon]|nr:signal peptidase I [Candidatus Woesearchaeota archaeon]
RTVLGSSLSPFINSGDKIKILFGYYNCYEIKREDIIIYNFAGNENPIIKIVKGIPEDKFELRKSDFGWNILINNQILKNFKGKPYVISDNRYKMLSLYERDYKGVIPKNAYLLLGNLVSGSVDSTRFGLVDKSNIIGKVVFE